MTTFALLANNFSAVAFPRPLAPPVIMIDAQSKSYIIFGFLYLLRKLGFFNFFGFLS